MKNQNNDTFSLAHTRWKCQYHIVFTPKYHRKIIYGALREEIGKILRELCDRKHIEIIEAHAMPDHIHMLVSIPPNEKVSEFMGYLKGKSTIIIFERYAHRKYKVGNRHFWSRGYYVSTVGGNKQAVQKYIQNQEKEDLISNQITMVEYYDPFRKWLESNSQKKDKKKKQITACLYAVGELVWHWGAVPVFTHFSAQNKAPTFSGGYLLLNVFCGQIRYFFSIYYGLKIIFQIFFANFN